MDIKMVESDEGSSRKHKKREKIKLDYSNILSPKNMRSVYWQYFGYPTNENNEIITKDKVVCTLCSLVIKNHNNTTNLRAHMQYKHKEIFKTICKENDIVVPPRKTQSKSRNSLHQIGDLKQRKLKFIKKENPIKLDSEHNYLQNSTSEIFVNPLTYEDTDEIADKKAEEFSNSEYVQMDYEDVGISIEAFHDNSNCSSDILGLPKILPIKKTLYLISSMLIRDLKDVSMIEDNGFVAFLSGITMNQVEMPTIEEVETIIDKRYTKNIKKYVDEIKKHSEANSFSMSFEIWEDINNKQFISIYVNYIPQESNSYLKNVLLKTVILNKFTNFEETLSGINLENCVAAIINKKQIDLELYLAQIDIPVTQCFLSVRDNCLERIFDSDLVSSTFNQVMDMMTQHAEEFKNLSVPSVMPVFPWTKFYLMKFFCENVSWPDEFNVVVSDVKSIILTLGSLETAMETLIEEETPLNSLIRPLVTKILEKYFQADSLDDPLTSELKNIIKIELTRSLLSNTTLTISAFLDPRFQRYLQNDSVDSVLNVLNEKSKIVDENRESCKKINNDSTSKRLSLKFLFEGDIATTNFISRDDIGIKNDVVKYRSNAHADFDQSPLVWWNKFGFMYTTLKKLSDKYHCIPFCVNMNFKNSFKQQIEFHKKRIVLPDKLKNQLLFLHYNKEYL